MLKKLIFNKNFLIIAVVLVTLTTLKVLQNISDSKIEAQRLEIKKLKIKNSTLEKVAEGHYTKLVADTLKLKELNKEVAKLKIKVSNPVILEKIRLVPIEVEKRIDTTTINQDSIMIVDYYPTKENWFTKYNAKLDLKNNVNIGKFTFTDLNISIVISEQSDGTFRSELKAPSFIKVTKLDVIALPMETMKVDNFGVLAGGMLSYNMENGDVGYSIMGGIRIKKTNIITSINTNKEIGIGTLIEF
jgi:hypothetical protein